MSNIYIQEPPSSGKVLLKTTVGDIDVELWARECPKACRNFVQLCMEGYYNGTIFHRVVKGFIVQGGDPCGDGTGGESIYGAPFKDEFHSRLRYTRRGLVGMANSDKDDNASQFFFTMAPTPELQNKNTLFGKVTGDTVFNMLKLEEGLVDHNERPMYPQKIISAEILSNPFEDIVPRSLPTKERKEPRKKREKGVKNFGLLSFGVEAEEDEEETKEFVLKNAGKAKSLHDVVEDPSLSKAAIKIESERRSSEEDVLQGDSGVRIKEEPETAEERKQRIKDKLQSKKARQDLQMKAEQISDSDEDVLMTQEQERKIQNEKRKQEIRDEITSVKKQYQKDKKQQEELLERSVKKEKIEKDLSKDANENEFIKSFIQEKEKYSSRKTEIPTKGPNREAYTLSLLAKFRSKLDALKSRTNDESEADVAPPPVASLDDAAVEEDIKSDDWLAHKLSFQSEVPVLAKDASSKGDDWYDVYDPRNPLNKRKRGEDSSKSQGKRNKEASNRN